MSRLHFLALSGSLRAASSNTAILRAAAQLADENVTLTLFEGLGALPHYNPDLDHDAPPAAVMAFRNAVRSSDGVIISSPEYAHGVPGVLKNALDWLVSSGEFVDKPVALLTASRATWAHASLTETLRVMTANLAAGASAMLPLTTNRLDATDVVANGDLAGILRTALAALAAESRKT